MKAALLRSAALVMSFALLAPLAAASEVTCGDSACTVAPGKTGEAVTAPSAIGENTERETGSTSGQLPFSISVDGEPLAGASQPADAQRRADVALENVDIQVKFDGLGVKPLLNVSTVPPRRAYQAGETVEFLASNNYAAWIERIELRIFEAGEERTSAPLANISVPPEGKVAWAMPEEGPADLAYVLRVYDKQGRFDETQPLTLLRTKTKLETHEPANEAIAPGTSEDRTAFRNIDLIGGAVTVYGSNIPLSHTVEVLGEKVPVDAEGKFVVQRVLPSGDHDISIGVKNASNEGLSFNREINIPDNEWFYVAMADLTARYRTGSSHIEAVKPGEYDRVSTTGRLAFYLKGKIKGRYLLTAAADTSEDKLENLFKGLDAKDPRQFLRRLDPDDYYPVYGDDSSAIEDAPTRGKFYVRLARGDSHVMWGNFKAQVTGTEFLRNERALYGANGLYLSEATTKFGERKSGVNVYAAQPGTLPQRDVLRGTGGSAYFLKHQDITPGSETLTVEVRDDISGRVIARRTLAYGHDYEIDYVQGVILLKQPLGSSATDGALISDGAIAGNALYLVANYEFTPAAGEVKGYAYGGRAHHWLGEKLRAGVTAMSEETGSADQQLLGADVQLRHSEKTFLEAEIAGSRGPGFGASTSIDGGISIFDQASTGVSGKTAMAYRIKAQADFGELSAGEFKGRIEGVYENLADNFSTLERHIDGAEQNYTVTSVIEVTDGVEIRGSYDEHREEDGLTVREASAQAAVRLDDRWSIAPGVKHSRRDGSTAAVNSDGEGERTDAGVRATYHWDEKRLAYVRVQGTIDRTGTRDRNDRAGLGGSTPLSEKVSLSGEVSYGTSGFGALAALDYQPTADDHYYLGYTLDPDRNDAADFPLQPTSEALGNAVAGARHRFSERLTAYGENRADVFGERQTLTQAYGVTYTPDARWTIGGGIESGRVFGDSLTGASSDFDRTAVSASAGYRVDETVSARLKGEFRNDDSRDGAHDATAYLLSAGATVSLSGDWRLIASGDGVLTDATETTRDGDYAEASLGFAYRAADNDRLNALMKYTFLYDLPGADQVTVNGTTDGPQQRSHIFAADVSFDVIPKLTLGAKYGVRVGSTRNRDGSGGWQDAIANLGILRADFHVIHDWDILLEGRALWTNPDETADFGVLAGVYRHINENLKLGAGYNFGRFSDDLRDRTFDDRGVFINLLGKL